VVVRRRSPHRFFVFRRRRKPVLLQLLRWRRSRMPLLALSQVLPWIASGQIGACPLKRRQIFARRVLWL
jgi:hypothetical protein